MVSTSLFVNGLLAAILLFNGQARAQSGQPKGTRELFIEVCKNSKNKCDWYMTLEEGEQDAFSTHNADCTQWTTPSGPSNGVYKFEDFDVDHPLTAMSIRIPKCHYSKWVSEYKVTHPHTKTCHFYKALVC